MQRRDILKRIGTASVAAIGITGTASARADPTVPIDRELDVTNVSGKVALDSLLSEADFARIPAGVDVSSLEVTVSEDADTITPSGCCCCECDMKCVYECQTGDCCIC